MVPDDFGVCNRKSVLPHSPQQVAGQSYREQVPYNTAYRLLHDAVLEKINTSVQYF